MVFGRKGVQEKQRIPVAGGGGDSGERARHAITVSGRRATGYFSASPPASFYVSSHPPLTCTGNVDLDLRSRARTSSTTSE